MNRVQNWGRIVLVFVPYYSKLKREEPAKGTAKIQQKIIRKKSSVTDIANTLTSSLYLNCLQIKQMKLTSK